MISFSLATSLPRMWLKPTSTISGHMRSTKFASGRIPTSSFSTTTSEVEIWRERARRARVNLA